MRCGRCKEVFDASANLLADVRYSPVSPPKAPTPSDPPSPDAAATPTATLPSSPPPSPSSAPGADYSQATAAAALEKPQVWSNARLNIAGLSGVPAPHPGIRLPDSLTQNISYGLRREANVVPVGWTPVAEDTRGDAPAALEAAQVGRIEPGLDASPSPAASRADRQVEEQEDQRDDVEAPAPTVPDTSRTEPVFDEADATASRTKIISQDPELISQESDDEEMPELTFESSRQFDLDDEPVAALPPSLHADAAVDTSLDPDVIRRDAEPETANDDASQGMGERVDTDAPKGKGKGVDAESSDALQTESDEALAAQSQLHSAPSEDEVGFMRDARRKAFWSKPAVRALLTLVVLGLLAGFAGQYAMAERNRLAAVYPALRPVLEQLCKPLQCVVGLPREIASVAIDSSTFTRVKDDSTAFHLQVALKSSADMVLEMPALELTMTDASDQPVLRRVLTREDTGAPQALPARGEWNGVVKLQVPEVADRVTGYRLLAFYP